MAQTSRKRELGFAAVMVLLSAALLVQAFMYPAGSSQFPRFFMVLQLIFSAILFMGVLRLPSETSTNGGGMAAQLAALRIPFQVFVAVSLYVVAIEHIGYFVATAIFLSGSMYWFGRHRIPVLIGASAGFILTVYALFVMFIGARLPQGLLI